MDFELYNEILCTKEKIEKYLKEKERDFNKLTAKLSGVASIASVDKKEILSSVPELVDEMKNVSSEYLDIKRYFDLIKQIIIDIQLGKQIEQNIEAYNLAKSQLEDKGILERSSLDDLNVPTLK